MNVSSDGIVWHKHPANPVLRPDPNRPWEANYVTSGSVMQLDDGSFRFANLHPDVYYKVRARVGREETDEVSISRFDKLRDEIIKLYSHAALFVCPSVYEPFGIINLEAAACETPVVASAVGGIPEVVVDGETGLLVPVDLRLDDPMSPVDPDRFERGLAAGINALMADPGARDAMGRAGRRRAVDRFGWESIAGQTADLYRTLMEAPQ